jgi:hypothetical protein
MPTGGIIAHRVSITTDKVISRFISAPADSWERRSAASIICPNLSHELVDGGNALQVTRDEHGPATAMIFQRERSSTDHGVCHPERASFRTRRQKRQTTGFFLLRRNDG